jgi:hypothetical protein
MLAQGTKIGTYNMMNSNFSLSFDIKPLLNVSSWSNIFHFTHNNADSSRMPAMWFHPGTFGLHLRFDGPGYGNNGFNGNEIVLPQGVWTNLSILIEGSVVNVTLNGTTTFTRNLPTVVRSGIANFFMANPWYAPANAWINNVVLNGSPIIFGQPAIYPPKNDDSATVAAMDVFSVQSLPCAVPLAASTSTSLARCAARARLPAAPCGAAPWPPRPALAS